MTTLPKLKKRFNILAKNFLITHPNGPDLTPTNYFLFLHLKHWLDGQRLEDDQEHETDELIQSPDGEFICKGLTGATHVGLSTSKFMFSCAWNLMNSQKPDKKVIRKHLSKVASPCTFLHITLQILCPAFRINLKFQMNYYLAIRGRIYLNLHRQKTVSGKATASFNFGIESLANNYY